MSGDALANAATDLLKASFGPGSAVQTLYVPGRLNLIGEHIDYHDLPVLPIGLNRGLCIAFRARQDAHLHATSDAVPTSVSLRLDRLDQVQGQPGDWANYVKAAALIATGSFGAIHGLDAAVASNLPLAAGLSSSSALLIGITLALLSANGIAPSLSHLMRVLPQGERFVGTQGGGMDHAAILAAQPHHALNISFNPFGVAQIAIPPSWRFLVIDSRIRAEKSAGSRDQFNLRRTAGRAALEALGFDSFKAALASDTPLPGLIVDDFQWHVFRHVISEAQRVEQAISALRTEDYAEFGRILNESHCSLRDQLSVSTPAVDALVEASLAAGAAGARIAGAGFGGCIVALCHQTNVSKVSDTLKLHHFRGVPPEALDKQLFVAQPSPGALYSSHV